MNGDMAQILSQIDQGSRHYAVLRGAFEILFESHKLRARDRTLHNYQDASHFWDCLREPWHNRFHIHGIRGATPCLDIDKLSIVVESLDVPAVGLE